MTDFGANIFDDSTPPADGSGKKGKRKPARAKKAGKTEAVADAPEVAVPPAPAAAAPEAVPPVDAAPAAATAAEAVPAPRKGGPRKPRSRTKATTAAPAPEESPESVGAPSVTEVPVTAPQWVHDDLQAVTFGVATEAPMPAPQPAPTATPADAEDITEPTADGATADRSRDDRGAGDVRREHHREARDDRRHGRGHRDGGRPGHDRRDDRDEPQRRDRDDRRRGGDHPRHDRRDADPRHGHRRPAPAGERSRQTAVGLLVDMVALADEARQQGGELALTRLGRALAGERRIAAALSFQSGKRAPVGFVAEPADAADAPQRLRQAARELADQGTALVLAPATDAMLELARELRERGASVELAGFVVRDDGGTDTLRLPRGCLFIP